MPPGSVAMAAGRPGAPDGSNSTNAARRAGHGAAAGGAMGTEGGRQRADTAAVASGLGGVAGGAAAGTGVGAADQVDNQKLQAKARVLAQAGAAYRLKELCSAAHKPIISCY